MNVLVVGAHPDDEVLGCGGTISRHISEGDDVQILIVGDGITPRYKLKDIKKSFVRKQVTKIQEDCIEANRRLGVNMDNIKILGHNSGRLDSVSMLEITKSIESVILSFLPNIIYTHGLSDVNSDHTIVCNAVMAAARPQEGIHIDKVLSFEVLSSTEWGYHPFKPNYYVYLSLDDICAKIDAMKEYTTELHDWPHPRSLEGIDILSQKRGSEIGSEYAEAFQLIREIA